MIMCESCENPITDRIMDIYMVGYTPRVCRPCFDKPNMEILKAKQAQERSRAFREWLGVAA